jgi:hypothetical protein
MKQSQTTVLQFNIKHTCLVPGTYEMPVVQISDNLKNSKKALRFIFNKMQTYMEAKSDIKYSK